MSENVEHPQHYGGEDNPYETIKVAEAWEFDADAYLFNVLKYISRPRKGDYLEDLKKARWYLDRKIARMEGDQIEKNEVPIVKTTRRCTTCGAIRSDEHLSFCKHKES